MAVSHSARAALLIVDVQRDFCPGGALAVPAGNRVVHVLNRCAADAIRLGVRVYASRDWHPVVSNHFKSYGGAWPTHCVQGTEGADFHPDLHLPPSTVLITKGDDPRLQGYSAFEGRTAAGGSLLDDLRAHHIEQIAVGGLATDYCVRESVLDAIRAGFRVAVLKDAVMGIDVNPGDSDRAFDDMRNAGAALTRSSQWITSMSGPVPT